MCLCWKSPSLQGTCKPCMFSHSGDSVPVPKDQRTA
nr:MAG TPA: hypothetical protein [Caudoviricetes sp.]